MKTKRSFIAAAFLGAVLAAQPAHAIELKFEHQPQNGGAVALFYLLTPRTIYGAFQQYKCFVVTQDRFNHLAEDISVMLRRFANTPVFKESLANDGANINQVFPFIPRVLNEAVDKCKPKLS